MCIPTSRNRAIALSIPLGMDGRSDGGITRPWARSPSSMIVRSKPAGLYELSSAAVSKSTRKE
ncbi:MAG: hypothetical protein AVDCRST_MAG19-2488 [uncultured Thermomicrobiales bacterium]|uniref:Uncharacterized protein n=1 Tax=uncultured Thermomicrobiales bacterium TaxID=1645740 RepID=A0A6J4V6D1_9BACT|nr:MAG: hypothetical protein AVDCRST_MAG19-2488 [uncultured Thermomicrobiales bacterium]